jgi:sterol desaturase/sphingolipid hydroxylase (fatty acid hydroxylase superfamily)
METILALLTPVAFAGFLVIEWLAPARPLPHVRGWFWKGLLFFFIGGAANTLFPMLTTSWVGARSPVNLSSLGTLLGALIAYLVSDFVLYLTHRLLHNVSFLWRWTHQLHHSAERIDIAGSNYFHPFDLIALGGSTSLAVSLLGVTADAAALAGFALFLTTTFAHLNVRTPQWLGWIIQRPEAHSVHHARGVHAYNYGTFMLWDILFGTFRNPATFNDPQGFWNGASAKIGPMLIGRDVSEPS